jgi:cardiolipin synthase
MRARDIPNLISLLRILLVLPVIYLLLHREFRYAMALFFVAGVSDALDGFLARHFDWRSRLGGILDPLADKFLLVSVFLCLGWLDALPWWLVALVILRDLVIVGGALAYHLTVEPLQAEPSLISKANTTFQILLALMVVYDLGFSPLPDWAIESMIWLVTFTVVASGIDYVLAWSRRAAARRRP